MFNYVGPAKPLEEVTSRTLDQGRFYKIDDTWMPLSLIHISEPTRPY